MRALSRSVVAGVMLAAAGQVLLADTDLAGHILFAGAAVPGATVTATHDDHRLTTTSDADGAFRFTALDDGVWMIRADLRGFVPMSREIAIPPAGPPLVLSLTMQSYVEMVGSGAAVSPPPRPPGSGLAATAEPPFPDAADILNGSTTNGAASPFGQSPAFGNGRPRGRPLYTGGLTAVVGNSAWNATPYSFVSGGPPAPSYGNVQLGLTLRGPLKIPLLITRGPNT